MSLAFSWCNNYIVSFPRKIISYFSVHFMLSKTSSSKISGRKEQTWIVLVKKNKIKPLHVSMSMALAGCICIAKVSGLGSCLTSYLCWLSKKPIPFYDPLCCNHKGKARIYFIAVFVTWTEWVSEWITRKHSCVYMWLFNMHI